MKKPNLREQFTYRFDNMMAKGTVALVGMLFAATAIVIVLAALVLLLIDPAHASLGGNVWASMMHIIDAGTITGADTADVAFIAVMSVATLCGLFVTSILIGIITTGFEEKLNTLKKGNSKVIESNHTVILGYDNNVFSLISELVLANENQKDGCIVILADEEKEVVETAIADALPDLKTTRVICRTGSITDSYMLKRCALESARSIIINESEDFITIKTILAVNSYLNEACDPAHKPHIVATIREQSNYDAAQIVAEGNAEIVLIQDSIARIIAQTCRQPGLSNVLIEFFDYDGDEFYFESFPQLEGHSFGDALNYFEKATLFGYQRDGQIYLNPAPDTLLQGTDSLLLLVEDDGAAQPTIAQHTTDPALQSEQALDEHAMNILILGYNQMLGRIVTELDNYFSTGSHITVAHDAPLDELEGLQQTLRHIELSCVTCDNNNRQNLEQLTADQVEHVLILSEDDCEQQTSDAMTLLKLIHLRDISQKLGRKYSITSEMQDTANQKLAKVAKANDLVVGSNIINLILTQISENRDLSVVFQELLQADGSEIYIRKASHFVQLHTPMNFYDVTNILKQRGQIAVGYKKQTDGGFDIITNPAKSESITFTEEDYIILLAED